MANHSGIAETQNEEELLKSKLSTGPEGGPKQSLNLIDVVALIVGIVIGAGIFRTPSLVAANSESGSIFLLVWIFGGIISFIGALCYAELTTTFPNAGGDYHFLMRAFGRRIAFLFAWARLSVIQTGSIALLSFIFGDYLTQIYSLGAFSSELYAAMAVIVLTGVNIVGVKFGTGAQKLLTTVEVLGILLIIMAGFFLAPALTEVPATEEVNNSSTYSLGLAMVFVLLTFGGWNEAAYISAELRAGRKRMVKALIAGIIIITIVYLLINLAYLNALGLNGMAQSEAVAADLMRITMGEGGVWLIAVMVAIAAVTSANATIFTGARSNYALGRDFQVFSVLGKWNKRPSGPLNAFIVQGIISLVLISLGLFSRNGFETIVEYTAPVFWFFFLMIGIALFVLRYKEPNVERPYRVPFYPVVPVIFCLSSSYLLYSSVVYTGWGAMVGIGVLFIGVILLLILPKIKNVKPEN
jgi:basic amino acid/polyamine antiporter, APA family